MNTWVLIIAVLGVRGNAITTQEFSNEVNCTAAKAVIESNMQLDKYTGVIKMECLKK